MTITEQIVTHNKEKTFSYNQAVAVDLPLVKQALVIGVENPDQP